MNIRGDRKMITRELYERARCDIIKLELERMTGSIPNWQYIEIGVTEFIDDQGADSDR